MCQWSIDAATTGVVIEQWVIGTALHCGEQRCQKSHTRACCVPKRYTDARP